VFRMQSRLGEGGYLSLWPQKVPTPKESARALEDASAVMVDCTAPADSAMSMRVWSASRRARGPVRAGVAPPEVLDCVGAGEIGDL
jgi:hypothetical protein